MAFTLVRFARISLNTQSATFGQRALFSTSTSSQWRATSIRQQEVAVAAPEANYSGSAAVEGRIRTTSRSKRRPIALAPIEKPEDFITAIAKPRRGDLKTILGALGDESTMKGLLELNGVKLKEAGVPIKERRYFLWCLERYKQGQHPSEVAYDIKPKKTIRGWGARVQNGIRVRGMKRPGEK